MIMAAASAAAAIAHVRAPLAGWVMLWLHAKMGQDAHSLSSERCKLNRHPRRSRANRAASLALVAVGIGLLSGAATGAPPAYDLIIRGGDLYDGSGGPPARGDIGIRGDRIVCVGVCQGAAAKTVDARGKAVAPGFINMLSQSNTTLIQDGRGQSELRQGVTLEVMGEGVSMGPLTPAMKANALAHQSDIKFAMPWDTLDGYLRHIEGRGVSVNVASFVGAATVRTAVLGQDDVDPTSAQLGQMRALVAKAMEDGAMGVSTGLIYAPGAYAETDEVAALATEAGRCGGIYISHMRSEGDRLVEAIDELIEISRRSGAPAEVFHLKASGRENWGKLDTAIAHIEAARARGQRITANMYTYPAGSTGFDAAMPTWVQAGGVDAWVARLKDPATRAKVLAEMREPKPGFENLYRQAGAEGTLLGGYKTHR